jgi:hypothetical protein
MRRARRLNRPGLPGSSESAVLLSNDLQAEATLNLDFRSGVLDPRIDFQRTTTGTYYRGLFNQNLALQSEAFNTWTINDATVLVDQVAAPNGTVTADKIVDNTVLAGHTATRIVSFVSGQQYTFSVYAKRGELDFMYLRFYAAGPWATNKIGIFDLLNGTAQSSLGSPAVSITDSGNGWYRCSITATADGATGNGTFGVLLSKTGTTSTYTGTGTEGIFVWGAQLTEGSLLTPYLPTTTAAITQGQIAAAEPWNLCIRSEEVNLWPSLLGATVTANAIVAPDGNTTADMVVEDTSTGQHRVLPGNQALGGTVDSSVYAISVYLKAGTRTRAQVGDNAQVSSGATWFDLSAGTVLSGTGTIVDAGNGWWRCTVFPAKSTATNSNPQIALVSSGTTTSYTGDGTSGLYVWGLQVNLGTSALPYRSTTTAALWLPRFENDPITGNARGLLIEGGATNLQLYSADITNGSVRVNVTVGATKITAPDGTASGELVSATTTAVTTLRTGTATISGTTVTSSMFVKKGSLDTIAFRMLDTVAASFVLESEYTFSTNTTTVTSGTGTLTATNVGNGWIRLALTATAWTAGNGLRTFIHFTGATATTGDSLYVWGVQVEAQSFASSYIPTTTATVARGADSALMTGTNFSSWYNQAEGTLLTDMTVNALSGERHAAVINAGNNQNLVFTGTNVNQVFAATRIGGTVYADVLIVTSLGPHKSASAYTQSVQAAAINGIGFADTATPAFVATMTQIHIGNNSVANAPLNGTISRLAYWPTRLPNETLQALTT